MIKSKSYFTYHPQAVHFTKAGCNRQTSDFINDFAQCQSMLGESHHSSYRMPSKSSMMYEQTQPAVSNEVQTRNSGFDPNLFSSYKTSFKQSQEKIDSFTELKQVPQHILDNLTQFEKEILESLFFKLKSLSLPKQPQSAFILYMRSFYQKKKLEKPFLDQKKIELEAKLLWRKECEETKLLFEQKSDEALKFYEKEFQEYSDSCEQIRSEIDEIIERADISRIVRKKISPYRIFKKELAPNIKLEFPNMRSQERQMIVKDRWRKLPDSDKLIFVIKARIEEERHHYKSLQAFRQQRIDFSKSVVRRDTQESYHEDQAKEVLVQSSVNSLASSIHVSADLLNQKLLSKENGKSSTTPSQGSMIIEYSSSTKSIGDADPADIAIVDLTEKVNTLELSKENLLIFTNQSPSLIQKFQHSHQKSAECLVPQLETLLVEPKNKDEQTLHYQQSVIKNNVFDYDESRRFMDSTLRMSGINDND
eukprot:403373850